MSVMLDFDLIVAEDCPLCGHGSYFVVPDCTEGHGAECPDRVCVDCGSALFVDPVVTVARTA